MQDRVLMEFTAEQDALTARYDSMDEAGKKLHDDFGYHLDDISDAHEQLTKEMGYAKYDEWRADLNEDKAATADELTAFVERIADALMWDEDDDGKEPNGGISRDFQEAREEEAQEWITEARRILGRPAKVSA